MSFRMRNVGSSKFSSNINEYIKMVENTQIKNAGVPEHKTEIENNKILETKTEENNKILEKTEYISKDELETLNNKLNFFENKIKNLENNLEKTNKILETISSNIKYMGSTKTEILTKTGVDILEERVRFAIYLDNYYKIEEINFIIHDSSTVENFQFVIYDFNFNILEERNISRNDTIYFHESNVNNENDIKYIDIIRTFGENDNAIKHAQETAILKIKYKKEN